MSLLVSQWVQENYYSNWFQEKKYQYIPKIYSCEREKFLKIFIEILNKTLPRGSTIVVSLDYYQFMTEFYSASSSVSPFTAILWCLYPVAVLVIIELLLGGGFDDDNNDDQDGGMLIPAYSRSDV